MAKRPEDHRRDEAYDGARADRELKRDRAEQALCDATNSYREALRKIENEFYAALDKIDARWERAIRRRK